MENDIGRVRLIVRPIFLRYCLLNSLQIQIDSQGRRRENRRAEANNISQFLAPPTLVKFQLFRIIYLSFDVHGNQAANGMADNVEFFGVAL